MSFDEDRCLVQHQDSLSSFKSSTSVTRISLPVSSNSRAGKKDDKQQMQTNDLRRSSSSADSQDQREEIIERDTRPHISSAETEFFEEKKPKTQDNRSEHRRKIDSDYDQIFGNLSIDSQPTNHQQHSVDSAENSFWNTRPTVRDTDTVAQKRFQRSNDFELTLFGDN